MEGDGRGRDRKGQRRNREIVMEEGRVNKLESHAEKIRQSCIRAQRGR